MSIGVGIYGTNGHQVQNALSVSRWGRLVAIAGVPAEALPGPMRCSQEVMHYETLEPLLNDPRVELIALCSPCRKRQPEDAIRALIAGKHVYAEKPCAMDEVDLDEILRVSRETGRMFHEMAGTAFDQPYFAMRNIVREGRIGEVVQIIAEKSYPYHAGRSQIEEIDGGLIGQNAIHALRFVEHVACARIQSVFAQETLLGNPIAGGELRMAANLSVELTNGGLASITANYLNQPGTGFWGDESLRILGTRGFVESTHGGHHTRFVIGNQDCGPIDITTPGIDYFESFLSTLSGQGKMPISLEEELRPTRWAIRAKHSLPKCPTPNRAAYLEKQPPLSTII